MTTMVLIQHLLVFVCVVGLTGAEVTLSSTRTLDGQGSMVCGSNVTLTCKISPYNGSMFWRIGNKTAMNCTDGSCQTTPPYHPNYGFAFQSASGTFNLSIRPVKFAENGKMFECSDGSMTAVITGAVKVFPSNTSTVLNVTNATAGTEMKVITGCVYPATNLNFRWYYFKTGMPPVLYEDGTQTDGNLSSDTCTTGDCGGTGVTQMTSALTFEEDEDTEEQYFLQAVISSPDMAYTVNMTSTSPYRLRLSGGQNLFLADGSPSLPLIIGLTVLGFIIAIAIVFVLVVCLRGSDNPEASKILNN